MADKIDQITLPNSGGTAVSYDIDLPPDATPSISSLTASGAISSGSMVNVGTSSTSQAQYMPGGIICTPVPGSSTSYAYAFPYGNGTLALTSDVPTINSDSSATDTLRNLKLGNNVYEATARDEVTSVKKSTSYKGQDYSGKTLTIKNDGQIQYYAATSIFTTTGGYSLRGFSAQVSAGGSFTVTDAERTYTITNTTSTSYSAYYTCLYSGETCYRFINTWFLGSGTIPVPSISPSTPSSITLPSDFGTISTISSYYDYGKTYSLNTIIFTNIDSFTNTNGNVENLDLSVAVSSASSVKLGDLNTIIALNDVALDAAATALSSGFFYIPYGCKQSSAGSAMPGAYLTSLPSAPSYIYVNSTGTLSASTSLKAIPTTSAPGTLYASPIGSSTTTISNFNVTTYLYYSDYSAKISSSTSNKPTDITVSGTPYVILKTRHRYMTGLLQSGDAAYQELIIPTLSKRYYRYVTRSSSTYTYGTWTSMDAFKYRHNIIADFSGYGNYDVLSFNCDIINTDNTIYSTLAEVLAGTPSGQLSNLKVTAVARETGATTNSVYTWLSYDGTDCYLHNGVQAEDVDVTSFLNFASIVDYIDEV